MAKRQTISAISLLLICTSFQCSANCMAADDVGLEKLIAGEKATKQRLTEAEQKDKVLQYRVKAFKAISDNWQPLLFAVKDFESGSYREIRRGPEFVFKISRDGSISDAALIRSSGVTEADMIALDAILGVSPLPALPESISSPLIADLDFNALYVDTSGERAAGCSFPSGAAKPSSEFRSSGLIFSNPNDQMQVVPGLRLRDIPMDVLRRYPEAVSKDDLVKTANEYFCTLSEADSRIRLRRLKWSEFFKTHPNATEKDLLDQQKKIQSELSALGNNEGW